VKSKTTFLDFECTLRSVIRLMVAAHESGVGARAAVAGEELAVKAGIRRFARSANPCEPYNFEAFANEPKEVGSDFICCPTI
jgi:hypothetical protein